MDLPGTDLDAVMLVVGDVCILVCVIVEACIFVGGVVGLALCFLGD